MSNRWKKQSIDRYKHVICRPRSVCIGKNCALGLGYGHWPPASGCTQDLWHSFSQYGPPGWQITYIYLDLSTAFFHRLDTPGYVRVSPFFSYSVLVEKLHYICIRNGGSLSCILALSTHENKRWTLLSRHLLVRRLLQWLTVDRYLTDSRPIPH